MTFARKIFDSLMPRGSAWRARSGFGMDLLFDGIADCFEIMRSACASSALLREPLETLQLSDLEREYGVVSTEASADANRRQYLHGIVYGSPGTGSADDLEDRLAAAGFTGVHVYQNDPAKDIYDLITGTGVTCGEEDASCGSATAYCGGRVGYVLVNGEMIMNPISYLTSLPRRYWPLVFVIAGSCSGGEALEDWDMERPDLSFWTLLSSGVSKTTDYSTEDGIRALKIHAEPADVDLDAQKLQPPTDADLVDWIRAYDPGTGVVENLAPGGTDWTSSGMSSDRWGPFAENSIFSAGAGTIYASVSVSASPSMSIGIWVEVDDFDTERTIFGNAAARTDPRTLQLWVSSTGLATFSRGDGSNIYSVSAQLTEGALHRIVVTQSYDGSDLTIAIYLDGELVESNDCAGALAPYMTYTSLAVGVCAMGAPAFLGRVSMLDTYSETKDAAWVASDWQSGMEILSTGQGVQQTFSNGALADDYVMTVSAWEVNGHPGAIMGLGPDGIWRLIWFGESAGSSRQNLTLTAFEGMSAIRLLVKHSSGIGMDGNPAFVVFDDVFIDDIAYGQAEVLTTNRAKFERLVLATKPVHSWALVLANYVPETEEGGG